MPSLSLRIQLDPEGRIGPGKIALLENIATHGSISAAGRAMEMSYRRAWMLVDEMNRALQHPVIDTATGGSHGGGAALTATGREVVARYQAIERSALAAAAADIAALKRLLSD